MRASSPAPSPYNQAHVTAGPFSHTPPPYPDDEVGDEPLSQPMDEDEDSYDEDPRLLLTRSYATAHDRHWLPHFLASDEDCCDPETAHLVDDLSDLRAD